MIQSANPRQIKKPRSWFSQIRVMLRTLLLLLCNVTFLYAQDPSASSFHGKVKSVTEHSYKAKKRRGEIVKGRPAHEYSWQSDFRLRYDSTGLLMSKVLMSKSGKDLSATIYYYDKNRMMTRQYTTVLPKKPSINIDYLN